MQEIAVFRFHSSSDKKSHSTIYELNFFDSPEKMCILEVEAESLEEEIEIPDFLRPEGGGELSGGNR